MCFKGPNAKLWEAKIRGNRERDQRAVALAEEAGWHVLRIWECDIRRDPSEAALTVLDRAKHR